MKILIVAVFIVSVLITGGSITCLKKTNNDHCTISNAAFQTVEQDQCYRSAQLSHDDLISLIDKKQIKTIINLRGKSTEQWWRNETKIARNKNVTLINFKFNASDMRNKNKIRELLEKFRTAKTPVLIHCLHGINRTGIVIFFWILYRKNPQLLNEAIEQLKD